MRFSYSSIPRADRVFSIAGVRPTPGCSALVGFSVPMHPALARSERLQCCYTLSRRGPPPSSGDSRSRSYCSAQPLRSRRRQPRLRWNTAACARAKPAGPEPFSRLFRYRAQSPSFPSRQ